VFPSGRCAVTSGLNRSIASKVGQASSLSGERASASSEPPIFNIFRPTISDEFQKVKGARSENSMRLHIVSVQEICNFWRLWLFNLKQKHAQWPLAQ